MKVVSTVVLALSFVVSASAMADRDPPRRRPENRRVEQPRVERRENRRVDHRDDDRRRMERRGAHRRVRPLPPPYGHRYGQGHVMRRHPRFGVVRAMYPTFNLWTSLDGFRDSDYLEVTGFAGCQYASSVQIVGYAGTSRVNSITVRYNDGFYDSRVPVNALLFPGQSITVDLPGLGSRCVDSVSIDGGSNSYYQQSSVSIIGLN
jgi:hypothetical protein